MAKRPSKYAYVNAITWPWHSGATSPEQHVWLRILGTTDIHGHILPYDYANDTLVDGFGFARVASHIRVARSEARNTLLFDNGDFLQGSPLTDIGARPENGWTGANPVLEVMNHVAYDAATIGNHEFNFGLEWLLRTLDESKFPLVCANAVLARHPDNPVKDQTLLPPFILLDRVFWDSSGTPQPLKIGVIGVLPPQILQWDRDNLAGRLEVRDMVETLKAYVPVLRNAGAQIVIVLAHSGIGEDDIAPGQENAGLALAQVPGVDAILTGHTHNLFPDQIAKPQNPKINSVNGTLAGVPSVMAGFRGSHLGVIDLKLAPRSNGWQISSHASEIWSVRTAEIEQDKAISVLVNAAHQATLRHTSQLVGQTNIPIHSYLSQFRPDPAQYLIMACKRAALTKALHDTEFAHLPVLSVSAPYKTGGSGGPEYYTDIPHGPLTMRGIADLYPFPNTLVGLRVRGEQLIEWLERAVSCFCQVYSEQNQQPLWNPDFVGNTFDTVCGLRYAINLAQPARYDKTGALINPNAHRINNLRHQGQPIKDTDEFVLALKSFRAFSSGMFAVPEAADLIYRGQTPIRDLLIGYIRQNGCENVVPSHPSWAFQPVENASVVLETGPGVMAYMNDIEDISGKVIDQTDRGFMRLEIPLK